MKRIKKGNVKDEFPDLDLQCGIYLVLGMLYFADICRDKALYCRIIDF